MSLASGSAAQGVTLGARVASNTAVLAASRFVSRGLGMAITVVLARYLGAEGYGIYQRAEAFVLLFGVLANLGLDLILTREVANEPAGAGRSLATVLLCKLFLGMLAIAALVQVAESRGYDPNFVDAVRLFALILLVNAFSQSLDAVLQGLQAMSGLALSTVAGQIVWTIGALACVVAGEGYLWVIVALLVGSTAHLAISGGLVIARHRIGWTPPSAGRAWYLIREALPLAFAASFVLLYQQVDAVMLGEMRGNQEVGWYKAGAKLLLMFAILRESFMLAIFPVISIIARGPRAGLGDLVTRAVRYQLVLAFFFVLVFVHFGRVAPVVFGADFAPTAVVLPVLVWLTIPQVVSSTCGRTLVATGFQSRLIVSTGVSLLVNVGGNLLLIPRYGAPGAAAASVLSEIVVAGLNVYFVHRFACETRFLRAAARPLLATLASGAVLWPARALPLAVGLPLAVVVFAGALAAFRVFSIEELRQGLGLIRRLGDRARRGLGPGPRPGPPLERGDFEE